MPEVPPAYACGYCQDVEVLDAGFHRGDEYAAADLQAMARNHALGVGLMDVPVVVGHDEEQPLVEGMAEGGTGDPAIGWVTALRVARRRGADGRTRPVLLADLDHVHPTVAALVNARAYRKVSPEVYDEDTYPEDAPVAWRGKALRRLAILGGEVPQIRTLRDLPPVRFAEAPGFRRSGRAPGPHRLAILTRTGRRRTADGRCWAVFSEVTVMDRATLEDQLKSLGWSDAMIEATKSLGDPEFTALANAALAQAAGVEAGGGGSAGGGSPAATPPMKGGLEEMAEFPEGMDRDAVIAELVGMGEDQAALAAMSDDELVGLWNQRKAGAEGGPGMAAPMSEKTPAGKAVAQFAEISRGMGRLARQLAAAEKRQASLDADSRRRKAAERSATVKAYCERWARDGYVTPAEVDSASRTPNLYHRLMHADGARIRKYGETAMSDFDAAVREIEARGAGWARRNAREQIPDPEKGKGGPGQAVSADRRRQLLTHTERGRAILREEDAVARRQGK